MKVIIGLVLGLILILSVFMTPSNAINYVPTGEFVKVTIFHTSTDLLTNCKRLTELCIKSHAILIEPDMDIMWVNRDKIKRTIVFNTPIIGEKIRDYLSPLEEGAGFRLEPNLAHVVKFEKPGVYSFYDPDHLSYWGIVFVGEESYQKYLKNAKNDEKLGQIKNEKQTTSKTKQQDKPKSKSLQKTNEQNIKNIVPPSQESDIEKLERKIHDLINQERQKMGLKSLQVDDSLINIAKRHSQDMAKRGYFAHENPEDQNPTDRANAIGYKCRKELGGGYYSEGIAENIFLNNIIKSTSYMFGVPIRTEKNSIDEIAKTSVDGWMNSEGHRQNILDKRYDREGIGVAISSDNKVYITQNFC